MVSAPATFRTETLGIDLASQAKKTAACVVAWSPSSARIVEPDEGLTDETLIGLMSRRPVNKVGVDAPFGWPQPFVVATAGYAETGRWPTTDRRELTLRTTDRYIHTLTGRPPLSVSTDLIAHTAFRCAELLTKHGAGKPVDRTGAGLVAEVYPAAALSQWGLTSRGYKGPGNAAVRTSLLLEFQRECSPWLEVSPVQVAQLTSSDHLFDALVAAFVARAVEVGASSPIPQEHRDAAEFEGWIHLPTSPLSELSSSGSVGLR